MAERDHSWRSKGPARRSEPTGPEEPRRPKEPPKRASWKGGGGAAGDDRPRHEWQDKAGTPGWIKAQRKNWAKKGIWTVVIFGLVAAFLYYLFWLPRPTPLIIATIAYYPDPIPPNAWAAEDAEAFQNHWPGLNDSRTDIPRSNLNWTGGLVDSGGPIWDSEPHALAYLQKELTQDGFKAGGPDKNVVLVYISGHGLLRKIEGKIEPCILLVPGVSGRGGWQPDRNELVCVRIRELLKTVRDAGPNCKKVVFFDSNRIDSDWTLGMLYNGFADRLDGVVREVDGGEHKLWVMNSAAPAQTGMAATGGSIFGYFVRQGLAGKASQDHSVVTLFQLADYVEREVKGWVRQHNQETQEPALFPRLPPGELEGLDLRLIWVEKQPIDEPLPGAASDNANWAEIEKLWRTHFALRAWGHTAHPDGRRRLDALSFEAFQQQLMRLERLVTAGKAYRAEAGKLQDTLTAFAAALERQRDRDALHAYSLPLASQWTSAAKQIDDFRTRVEQALARTGTLSAEKESEEKSGLAQTPYWVRAQTAWDWLLNRPAGARASAEIGRALDVVGSPGAGGGLEPIEMHFLRLLTDSRARADLGANADLNRLVKLALASRDAAERTASGGGDERTQFFIRATIAQADDDRRQAEDLLFVGGTSDLKKSQELWDKAAGEYAEAKGVGDDLSKALEARDRCFAQLPYFAQWIERRRDLTENADELVTLMRLCVDVLAKNQQLAAEIEDGVKRIGEAEASSPNDPKASTQAVKSAREQIVKTTRDVEDSLRKLDDSFGKAVGDIQAKPLDALTLRDISDILSTPLVSGEDRISLLALSRRRSLPTATRAVDNPTSDRLTRLRQWRDRHPALAMLDDKYLPLAGLRHESGDPAPTSALKTADHATTADEVATFINDLADAGDQLHRAVRSARKELEDAAATPIDTSSPVALRAARSHLDRRAREVAALLCLPEQYRQSEDELNDPIGKLLQLDLHELLVWHGRRGVEDFWGDEAPAAASDQRGNDSKYFDALGTGYLDSARAEEPLSNNSEQALTAALAKRRKAAERIVSGEIETAPLLAGSREFATKVQTVPDAGLPKGTISWFPLFGTTPAEWKTRLDDPYARRRGLPTDVDASAGAARECSFRFPADTPNTDSNWDLVSWYRGNVFDQRFRVTLGGPGREVVFLKPDKRFKPKIQVVGDREDAGAIAFILDCSGSMMEEVAPQTTRMDRAKEALKTILNRLANVGGYKVSLWFYGHRRGFDNPVNGVLRMQWNHAFGPDNFTVSYGADVQQVKAPTVLDPRTVGGFFNEIDKATPWGCTPLYYAIKRAVEDDLLRQPNGAPRRLIVVTDGLDQVWFPKIEPNKVNYKDTEFGREAPSASVAELVELFTKKGQRSIDLTTLLCDVAVKTAKEKDKLAAFENFIEGVHGKRNDVNVGQKGALVESLLNAIGPTEFEVHRLVKGKPTADTIPPQPLNNELALESPPPFSPHYYEVTVPRTSARARVAVESEEALMLWLSEGTLTHRRYDPDHNSDPASRTSNNQNPNHESDDANFNPPAFYLAAQVPQPGAGEVVFPVSIQNGNERLFSPRPAEAWIEIKPVFREGREAEAKAQPFLFYDLEFKPQTPVPVINCRAPRWPADAVAAEIQIWFKLGRTAATKRVQIRNLAGSPDAPDRQLDLPTAGGRLVRFAVKTEPLSGVRGSRVVVTEIHDPEETDQFPVKVELGRSSDETETPDEIRHSYQGRKIVHSFTFKEVDVAALGSQWLEITSRPDLQKDAIRSERPLQIAIPRR